MSVVMEHITVLKHVITLKEVSVVDAIVAFYWMMMRLPVTVWRSVLCILMHNVTHVHYYTRHHYNYIQYINHG